MTDAELDEIEAELDETKALMRRRPRQRDVPAIGGGTLRPARGRDDSIRPRPAAFARAVAVSGLTPLAAAFQAGYRAPNRMTTWRLLHDPKVRAEIDRLSPKATDEVDRDRGRVNR